MEYRLSCYYLLHPTVHLFDLIIQLPNELKLDTLINVLNTIEDDDFTMYIGKEEQ